MAIGPTVSPYTLLQALQQARARGAPNDYYGLGHALDTVGKSYTDLNNQVQKADTTFNDLAKTDARTAAGYYPAQAGADVALANQKATQAKQQQMEMEDLQQAVNAARSQGLTSGTPQFIQYIQSHVNTLHGMRNVAPEIATQAKQLQNQQIQLSYLENQVPKQIARTTATEIYNRSLPDYEQRLGFKLDPRGREAILLWQQSLQAANQHVADMGLQTKIDPVMGTVTVTDKDNKVINLDPELLSTAMKMGGNSTGYDLFQTIMNNKNKDQATTNATTLAQGKAGLEQAQADAGGFKPNAPKGTDDISKHILQLNKDRSELRKQWVLGNVPDDKYKQASEEIDAELKSLHKAGTQGLANDFSLKGLYDLPPDTDPYKQGTGDSLPTQYGNYGDTTGRVPGMDYASPPIVRQNAVVAPPAPPPDQNYGIP